ncbi:uncharacterized protein [Amphiura filiformis]|uniref:uncharacterized protein n=1 Tax=Amphiura filiformis TaxID=82378 RepID=UPI003B2129A4
MLKERPDPSRGGVLRWSLPYKEICYCQGVVAPKRAKTCPRREDEYEDGDLWFVDDPSLLIMRQNWRKDILDELMNRASYCEKRQAPVTVSCPANVDMQTDPDLEVPLMVPCPTDQGTETNPGKATAMVVYQNPTATDNSGEVSVVCYPPSESEFAIGQTMVTCEARDSGQNSVTCEFQVDIKEEYCSTGLEITEYPHIDTRNVAMVSPDMYILCNGVVTEWRLYPKATGILKAIIWRQESGDSFRVVGINTFDISTDEINKPVIYVISESERIEVQAGDMIGWASQDGVLAFDFQGDIRVQLRYTADVSSLAVNGLYQINDDITNRDYAIHATVEPFEDMCIINTAEWYWIGLTDTVIEGTFVWTDNSQVDYHSWSIGEPNNLGTGEDCVVTWLTNDWVDLQCGGTSYQFVCKKDAIQR